jgi:hypothetical protein
MVEVLLSSEAFIKSVSSVSDNLSRKYILPSLREAQEVGLKGIVGSSLLEKLKSLVKDGLIEQNAYATYKALLDKCQYYLAYVTIVEVSNKTSFKVGNFGVAKSTDENLQVASQDEIAKIQYYYQSKADACCYDLQAWLIDHRADFPELNDCDCRRLSSNLHSAASCGFFLGGARGKKRRS